ncbi:hypothetical protein GWN42_26090 [candidate division KSB1 bacterium]|nr:hypothetical protein [candidate division KSB1 bacterium]
MRGTKLFLVILFAVAIICPANSIGQIKFNGGKGLTYVHSAWTLDQGFLTLSGHSRSFGKVANFPNRSSFTVWDVTGRININYGIGKHFELSAAPVVYQDTNTGGNSVNSPDDLFVSLKIGSFSSPGSSLAYGFLLGTRFPTGDIHNIPFEPYAADNVGFGFMGLVTYSRDPLYPEEGTSVHFNLGYWNHNDVGAELIKGGAPRTEPTSMSQELLYGIGINVPRENFDFSAELYGNVFLQSPPPSAYSRENYLYITPTVTYKPYRWLGFSFGVDVRITNSTDKTLYQGGVGRTLPGSQPNYPAWRVNLGTKFALLPTTVYRRNERDILMQKAQTRRELFEQIIKEQRETEAAESELERIKSERIRAEKELERLRRILEGQAKSETEGKSGNEANGTKPKSDDDNN